LVSCPKGKNILRVSENRVLRRIFEHKLQEVTKRREKLNEEELRSLYSTTYYYQVKEYEVGGTCSTHLDDKCVATVFYFENMNGRVHF
jgi:hypothetical protein